MPQTTSNVSMTHILSRACNQPQFLEPTYATTFFSALGAKEKFSRLIDTEGQMLEHADMKERASSFGPSRERDRPYQVKDGLAILPISGTLLHKYGYLKPYSGSTGYDGIIARLNDAANDPSIKAIMLDIDSPGGEAAGCFDCAETILKLREIKPIYALCYDTMCSAAMAIGSACTERWITQSGRAGSVGVVVAHASYQDQLKENGIDITLIHSGKHKVDGNPYEKLSDDVLASIQANLNQSRDAFAALVAKGIGMDKQAVLDTEAKVFTGQQAIDVGFADRLVNGQEAVPLLLDILRTNSTTNGVAMSLEENQAPKAQANGGTAEGATLTEADVNQARLDGATAERERIGAILSSEHAQGRAQMATHLALKTSMSTDEANALLAVSPAQATLEVTESKGANMQTALDEAMASTEQPNLETSGDAEELSADEKCEQALLGAHDAVFGKGK